MTELYHYGVKGMKWGVRRSKEELKYNKESIKASVNRYLKTHPIPARSVEVTRISNQSKKHIDIKLPKVYTVKITEIHDHAFDQAADRKVTAKEIIKTIEKPTKIDKTLRISEEGLPSVRLTSDAASVNVNPEKELLVTLWNKKKKV